MRRTKESASLPRSSWDLCSYGTGMASAINTIVIVIGAAVVWILERQGKGQVLSGDIGN